MPNACRPLACVAALAALLVVVPGAARAQMVTGRDMAGFDRAFGLDRDPAGGPAYTAGLAASSAPGNILWPGEKAAFTVRVTNGRDEPLRAKGRLEVIAYGTKGEPGDIWKPTVVPAGVVASVPVSVDLRPKGVTELKWAPAVPARFGGYALVLDLGPGLGRRFVASFVRTFKPDAARVQYPSLSLDDLGPTVLSRLGVHAVRHGISYKPTTDKDFEEWYAREGEKLHALHNAGVTVLAMFGGGDFFHPAQPLGRPRPWLDDKGAMQDTKFDLAWLPSYDPDFKKFVARFAAEYGWPKGPITAVSLWNEPWEGISISGWGADMLRYREMYTAMAEGVEEARTGGADVLVGGCDSSSNALDKLFPDGSDAFLPRFDFLSVHYQGMASFATYKPFVDRKGPRGRVRIWDTESWVANTDDRVAAVIAANRSTGYDRAMGVFGGNISDADDHDGNAGNGAADNAWSTAAAVGAAVHFVGERPFRELLFRNGLPWVMVFGGSAAGRVEDGTVVVVGDIGEAFGADNVPFRTARGLAEVRRKEALRKELATAPPDRAKVIRAVLDKEEPLSGATMTLPAGPYALYDFYGNPVPARSGRITVPLDGRGFFLRGDGRPGSFAKLLAALRTSRIEGIEPLATVAHDFTTPIPSRPDLRLTLTNVLNRPIAGTLKVSVTGITLANGGALRLSLAPNETREMRLKVTGGTPNDANTYPLALRFDAGRDGFAVHYETLHANVIARRTITVDGDLSDWKGALPQTVIAGDAAPTVTEAAWFPFKKFDAGTGKGLATGWLAWDDANFYFAAKVADSTPDGGTLRFETRDDDQFFYPATSYGAEKGAPSPPGARPGEPLTWPAGVRHYSYRKDPILPAGSAPAFDNVQIAFNVLPPDQKRFYPNPPGTMPGYTVTPDMDYEFALNKVGDAWGGGTEIWRLASPAQPLKHFYPRQPKSPADGPAKSAKLAVTQEATTRTVECAIPWSEIPEVKRRLDAGQPIKFSFRVNDNAGIGCMELSRNRSVAKRGGSFHVDWVEHWSNEVEFAAEPASR
jgi:hypothetical protein